MRHPILVSALLVAATASHSAASTPSGTSTEPATPAVVVDYSAHTDSYRVTGDVALLSQRFTPGTTLDLMIAAAALETGDLTPQTEFPGRGAVLTLPQAFKDSSDEFFAQVLKRTGYEPLRKLLQETRYTPGIPEAVSSFADLARGEPLRVSVFEQNLFFQALVNRRIPIRAEHCATLERYLAVEGPQPAWGRSGWGEISPEGPRYVSWFNGAARLKDGKHVITVIVLTPRPEAVALAHFRRYLAAHR